MSARAKRRHDFRTCLASLNTLYLRIHSFLAFERIFKSIIFVMSNSIASNRSTLKEFLASIATIQGDLSNITAPPFVLGGFSTAELPQYWADHPSLFVAPALGKDAQTRALLVLKWFLGSLKNQQYAGRNEEDGVKKPLNAFLGELFLGQWNHGSIGETRLVSEQVSHHPPVTACYLWNDKHGIRAEGFTQQEITFSGSVSIKQKGYAVLRIEEYEEDYLIPVPNVKVKGILGRTPYPELVGTYSIISSTGIVSEIKFKGKGLIGSGSKNGFEARTYSLDTPNSNLYVVSGSWNGNFTIENAKTGEVDVFDTNAQKSIPITVPDRSEQDPWESRRAWSSVIDALGRGDMKGTAEAKSVVEEGQRKMRKDEEAQGKSWKRMFFQQQQSDPLFDKLSAACAESFTVDPKGGIWKVNKQTIQSMQKPFHGNLTPTGQANAQSQGDSDGHTEIPESPKVQSEANGVIVYPNGHKEVLAEEAVEKQAGQASHEESIQDAYIEEMLRAKYQSAQRQ